MLDLNFIRDNAKDVEKNALNKGVKISINKILGLDKGNRELLTKIGNLRAELKAASKVKPDNETVKKLKKTGEEINKLESKQLAAEDELRQLLLEIPAMARPDVKIGHDGSENEILRKAGEPTKFEFQPKDYMEIGESLDLIDVKRASKVSGPRFGYLKNEAALLEFALVQYVFEILVKQNNFIPFVPPVMISEKAMEAMGYLQHGGEQETYHFKEDKLYFVGTSEQSIGPYHMDEILDDKILPLRYCSFSTCFRREAGAAGKDTRGILRVHQFDKVEMFVFCKPEDSDKEHENLLMIEEKLVSGLKLPYQVIKMCTGDLGLPAARKYDIETWLPMQQTYRETHSTSSCVDFQARRLNIRYKDKKSGKNLFIHTLNGTAFAIGRMLIMILENFQQADGTVLIPEVLQKYMFGAKAINKK